jgi:ATP-dependent helicase HrpB
MADFLPPEILGADLAPLLLEILKWGVTDSGELIWLDPPRAGQVSQARVLLTRLGALDEQGALTEIGRQIASLPLHPRLALMLLRGREQGDGPLACQLAALLQNRDLLGGRSGEKSVDIEDRLEILRLFEKEGPDLAQARGADPSLCRRILQEASQYRQLLGIKGPVQRFQGSGNLLAHAYPDRIAQKKAGSSQHLLSSGRGVLLPAGDHLNKAEFLVAANVDAGKKQGRIFLGAALSRDTILSDHGHLLTKEERVVWHDNKVEAYSIQLLGSLELVRVPLTVVSPEKVRQCLTEAIQQAGITCLGWQKNSRELKARIEFAHNFEPDKWPDVSDSSLLKDMSWLEPYLDSITTLNQLQKIDLYVVLLSQLSWQAQQELDRRVPTHLTVPSGSKKRLLYQPREPPVLSVRLQEMFGALTTPTVMDGKVSVLVHLLSPAGRPIQVTQDLAGFWQRTYGEVKKELKGRYPKHFWPDDPLTAKATSRVRPK